MYINHVGTNVLSLGGNADNQVVAVLLFSIFNATGRLSIGALSDWMISYVPRVVYLVLCMGGLSVTLAGLAFAWEVWMVEASASLVGFTYGGLWAVFPTLVSLLFGMKNFGQNWGWMVIASASGGMLFGVTASRLYDMQVAPGETHHRCYGSKCYTYAYLISAVANGVAAVVLVFLLRFTAFGKTIFNADRSTRPSGEEGIASVDEWHQEMTTINGTA
jgi:MFS family permease